MIETISGNIAKQLLTDITSDVFFLLPVNGKLKKYLKERKYYLLWKEIYDEAQSVKIDELEQILASLQGRMDRKIGEDLVQKKMKILELNRKCKKLVDILKINPENDYNRPVNFEDELDEEDLARLAEDDAYLKA